MHVGRQKEAGGQEKRLKVWGFVRDRMEQRLCGMELGRKM
jgi:hypothetical protein